MNLSELQDRFYSWVTAGEATGDFEENLIPGGTLGAAASAIDIHARGYIARLTEALGETYKSVWFVLGDATFFAVCEAYIKARPSITYSLSLYGHDFAEFLVLNEVCSEFPFLPELAEFELAFTHVFHSPQTVSVSAAELFEKLSADLTLKLGLSPELVLCQYSFPVYQIWLTCKDDAVDHEMDLNRGENICLYKSDHTVYVKTLETWEFFILRDVKDGCTLAEIFEKDFIQDVSHEAMQGFFRWLAISGIVCSAVSPTKV